MLEVVGVTKRFGGVRAVDDVSFAIGEGEAVALVGPNGAGKTTLFNIVAGFDRPKRGRVVLLNRDITALASHERVRLGLARSFQIPKPFVDLTVLENVLVACEVRRARSGRRAADKASYARGVLSKVGLDDRAGEPCRVLSVGEAKRLELARVLATNPDLVLLDEPFGGLTAGEIAPLASCLTALKQEGRTILVVEHRLREVFPLVRRVLVMDRGSLIADGSPAEVVASPAVLDAYFGEKGVKDLGLL